ncbi:16821_t:CDS:1 [Funneliformis geosporum]|uniref:6376_t:CDS:1 n=1 Tax=Funneliformis geosporum TaxID=1117311 RepID=A0A9W4WVG4_9GLOM|nr:16821_t:CDS:1 [Funneliformis geosporum]CAI2182012.1 6376_t:CDS:1 [Funneliformis geosporum]
MYKLVSEKRLEKAKREVEDNLYFILEQYLDENELPTPKVYLDYQKEEDITKRAELYKKCDIHAKKYRANRIIKTKEFHEKNKDKYPELKDLIESELKEEERVIKNLEETIKTFDYLK